MTIFLRQNARWLLLAALLLAVFFAALPARAELDLQRAIQQARQLDPQNAAIRAQAEALAQTAVADAQWQDPSLKLGIANLPTDSFAFDEQPMTQKVIGIRQEFPRGNARALIGERGASAAAAGFASAADQALALERDVSITYLSLAEQLRVRALLDDNRCWLQQLVDYNRARLASAQVQSQQLLQSQLALARLDDRIAGVDGEISRARGQLSRWIGPAAWEPADSTPPAWRDTRDWLAAQAPPLPLAIFHGHPAIAAREAQIAAARADVDLAGEAYKPQFGLDVSYGQRDRTPESDGADFASVMLTFDLPLFRKNRQDRRVAASRARESAAQLARQDLLQQMHGELNGAVAMANTLARRRAAYDDDLLVRAESTADAVLQGYASNTADLEAVIDARLQAIEAQISAAQLTYGYFRALARIRYFRAESSRAESSAMNIK